MSNRDDDILARELGKLGELGAKLGGLTSGRFGVAKAGALGAQFAAKFLPTETYTEKLALKIAPERALKLGFSVLAKLGELQSAESKPSYPLLKAVIGSGFLKMNPAVVYLEILEGDSTGCEVTITAAAKEGLIKQQTAAKAVQRVVSALRGVANGA
jgi:hypothetical protein